MTRPSLIALLATIALAGGPAPAAAQSTEAGIRLLNDVRYLSSDELGGRLTGQPGADSAAAYIARRFEESGLWPSPNGWFQEFTVSPDAPIAKSSGLGGAAARNVIGVLPGRDSGLRDEIVVVGAHYDHLGPGHFGALDSAGPVHNGADDNASGSSALIHIAKRLAAAPPARTVVFVAFSGEEGGLLGSANYVKQPVFPLAATYAMVNLDMVGRIKNNRLIVFGAGTASEFPALLDSLNAAAQFDLKASGDGWGPSDHASFYGAGKPVLHVFTDLHEDYHRASDDWGRIEVDGLERVANYTAEVVRALADRKDPLTFVNVPPPPPPAASASGGGGASLGTIPDMTENPGGVRLSGVRAGSAADKAGLRAGDIIIGIGD
ncbi:MAG: M28 family peptidase, partial [Gemmatimonadota bacterium]|nr:M28 family peptidase [Gemmatimonadota bacterium]